MIGIAAIPFVQVQGGLLLQGAMTGLAYGLLAAGLILVYRATRVINFAHVGVGAFAAALMAKLMLDEGWAYVPAAATALGAGLALGGLVEVLVVRPLFDRPRLVVLVGTLGASQVLSAGLQLLPQIQHPNTFPSPVHAAVTVGATVLNGGDFALLLVVPLLVGGLAWWWRKSAYGLAVRAIAENADGARLAAIPVRKVSLTVFLIAGLLSAAAIILLNPARAVVAGNTFDTLGASILLRALLAAIIGRFRSVSRAMVGGVLLGMAENELYAHTTNPGYVDGYLFLILCGAVVLFGRSSDTDLGSWSLAPTIAPVPRELLRKTWLRHSALGGRLACITVAVVLPLILTKGSAQFTLAEIAIYALIGVSTVVLTGWSGQISLAQFAFAGLGAFITARLVADGVGLLPAVVITALIGVCVAAVLGIPALRIRGVYLAVVTMGFAVAVANWLLPSSLLSAGQTIVTVTPGKLGPLNLADQRTYYWFSVAVVALTMAALTRLRRGSIGRSMIAVRDNEAAALAFGLVPALIKVRAFAIAGGIAALAGGLLAGLLGTFSSQSFSPEQSLTILSMVVIGGVGSPGGAVAGAVGIIGIPTLLGTYVNGLSNDVQSLQLMLSGLAVVQILRDQPGGLAEGIFRMRERLARRAAGHLGADESGAPAPAPDESQRFPTGPDLPIGPLRSRLTGAIALRVRDMTVSFGGVVANDAISLDVRAGEILGLIGNNGAGKTTLMNAISGFVPTAGHIEMYGSGIASLSPSGRARRGLGRCFQGAHLFPGLTVAETLACSLDRLSDRGRRWRPRTAQMLEAECEAIADSFGLTPYLDKPIADLSTGTRRVVEIACVAARKPSLILLDEPTAGVAQRDVEAFGPLLLALRDSTGAAIVIVEHDLPLVIAVSDRIVALANGRVIADGEPAEVRNHPDVIASYLGNEHATIERSRHMPAPAAAERN